MQKKVEQNEKQLNQTGQEHSEKLMEMHRPLENEQAAHKGELQQAVELHRDVVTDSEDKIAQITKNHQEEIQKM